MWNADLSRDGPGLLLQGLESGRDKVAAAVLAEILRLRPDVLLLSRFDGDYTDQALNAFRQRLVQGGLDYGFAVAGPQNRGLASPADLNGDGLRGGRGDVQGWGRYSGDGGMVVLSQLPLERVQDHHRLLWRDLPGGAPQDIPAEQRLSSSAHWVLRLALPDGGSGYLLSYAAGSARFGDPRRTAAETQFWQHWLAGAFGPVPPGPLLLMGFPNDKTTVPVRHSALRDAVFQGPGAPLVQASAHWQLRAAGRGAEDQPGGSWPQQIFYADLRLVPP